MKDKVFFDFETHLEYLKNMYVLQLNTVQFCQSLLRQNDIESVMSCAQIVQNIWTQQFCKTAKINRD